MHKLSEILAIDLGVEPADSQDESSAVFLSMADYDRVMAIAEIETMTDTKILTVQLRQATDAAGSGAKDLGTAGTFTAATAVALMGHAVAEANSNEMDTANSFTFVGVRVTTDEGGNLMMGASIIRGMAKARPAD